MSCERASERAFFAVSALLFAASAAVTIVWRQSMAEISEMPMCGWTMSMAWMRMPAQTWPGAAASFLGMGVAIGVAMMLPTLVPMLWRYRQAVGGTGQPRLGRLTALVGVGCFFVWTAFGVAAFPLGVALEAVEMQLPALAGALPSRSVWSPDRRRAPVHRVERTSPARRSCRRPRSARWAVRSRTRELPGAVKRQ
jgi:predicted metal-binding membrane protein